MTTLWIILGVWLVMAIIMAALFLLKVTGIPATEARSLESRGDAYREYERRTSVFFPWAPKRKAGSS